MSINSKIISALQPLIPNSDPVEFPTVTPNSYEGDEDEYIVFDCIETPVLFAEGKPNVINYTVVINYYAPLKENTIATRNAIKLAMLEAGATYPTATPVVEGETQRYIFECEMAGAVNGTV